jgi:hypothetical protein
MSHIPVTGNPIIDTATKVFGWLGEQVERIVQPPALGCSSTPMTCPTSSYTARFTSSGPSFRTKSP